MHVKIFKFSPCEVNDLVKFKRVDENRCYHVYYGTVVDVSNPEMIGVINNENDTRLDYPKGITIWINKKCILQIYSYKNIKRMSSRLALKSIWKKIIFREVKAVKYKNLMNIDYKYININGNVRVKHFKNINNIKVIPPRYHQNLSFNYYDYYGFTTGRFLRNNDKYYDREIFFSKKCYSELDFDRDVTGDFYIKKELNHCPPKPGQLICGLVENGEKGLFFRKWFVCSHEFLTLWTMVCEPHDESLKNKHSLNSIYGNSNKTFQNVKPIHNLINELDTSHYSANYIKNIQSSTKCLVHNIEKTALYFPDRYQQIAKILFKKALVSSSLSFSHEDVDSDYIKYFDDFIEKLKTNILWMKNL